MNPEEKAARRKHSGWPVPQPYQPPEDAAAMAKRFAPEVEEEAEVEIVTPKKKKAKLEVVE